MSVLDRRHDLEPALALRSVKDSLDGTFGKVRYSNLPRKRFLFNNVIGG